MNHTPTPYAYRMEGDSMAIIFHQTPTGEQRITRTASVLGEDNAAFIVRACNSHGMLVKALKRANQLNSYALDKFNWGRSSLDAKAIALLNEVPGEVRAALKIAKRSQPK